MAGNSINGKDMFGTWGARFQQGAYSEFLTPPPIKDFIENEDRSQDGTQVLPDIPRLDEREVNVNVILTADTEREFITRYNSFVAELTRGGWLAISIPRLNTTFRMLYVSSTKFGYYGNTCTLSIRFREPNPANRSNVL